MSPLSLRIAGRLNGGFAALLMPGLAGFALWQLGAVSDRAAALESQSRNSIRIGDIAGGLHAIRRAIPCDETLTNVTDPPSEAERKTTSEERRAAIGSSKGTSAAQGEARRARQGPGADATRPQAAASPDP